MSIDLDNIRHYLGIIRTRADEVQKHVEEMAAERDEITEERDALKYRLNIMRSTAVEETSRAPRIVTADELRVGQVVLVYRGGHHFFGRVNRVSSSYLRSGVLGWTFTEDGEETIVLLEDAPAEPEPELPTTPGALILITHANGEKLDQPTPAIKREGIGLWAAALYMLGGIRLLRPESITGWRELTVEENT